MTKREWKGADDEVKETASAIFLHLLAHDIAFFLTAGGRPLPRHASPPPADDVGRRASWTSHHSDANVTCDSGG